MKDSQIEWTDHTFNPWWGCAHVSPGCVNCYAETFAKRYGHDVWGKAGERRLFGDKHWQHPVQWNREAEQAGRRAKVFCASMADVFEDHPALPGQRERLWDLIARTPWLDWQLLTKRPENIAGMLPAVTWPNVWLGTSVEDQDRGERVRDLLAAPQPVAVRFLSCEPLLGPVNLWHALGYRAARGACRNPQPTLADHGIGWVIVGGESGPGARPMALEWARSLVSECRGAGVPVFVKQMGKVLGREIGCADAKGHDMSMWPTDLLVRGFPAPAAV